MQPARVLTHLSCLATLALASPAGVTQPARGPAASAESRPTTAVMDGRVFQRLDANGDGRLTREEARIDATVTEVFDRIDADGDGIVSREEARRYGDSNKETGKAADPLKR